MKDPENGEEMKGEAPEEKTDEPDAAVTGEPAGKMTGESDEVEDETESPEGAAEESAAEGLEGEEAQGEEGEEEDEGEEGEEAPAGPGAQNLNRPLIAGGIAVIVLSWVAIIVLAFLLATSGNKDTTGIDEVVRGYFQAYSEGRVGDAYQQYYSPDDLSAMAETYGMNVEDFIAYIDEGASSTSGLSFEGIEYDVTFDDVAVVTITAGTAVYADEEGAEQSEELADMKIELVNKDGKWYMRVPSQ